MSDPVWQWPALDLRGRSAPERLDAARAVWGKVHGAASDFRWIASSPGLDLPSRSLERELLLGSEDAPEKAACWRPTDRGYCAVVCYPSRAVDAALRSGFLEKQLLEWSPGEGAPAALGALTLLPEVSAFDDGVWWDESGNPGWSQPGFALVLEPLPPLPVPGDLNAAIERGRAALRDAVEERALARFYSALLAGSRPALLAGLERPLPPEAVAVLLLPLPRDLADRLSIAGWIVSQRIDPESFPRLWDILICNRIPTVLRDLSAPEITDQGKMAARSLLESGAVRIGSRTAVAVRCTEPAGISGVMDRLLAFANDGDRRWLGPEDLAGGAPLQLWEGPADALVDCVQRVQEEVSRLASRRDTFWKREHLQTKADLLRAATLALAPQAILKAGLLDSKRVPALLFCPRLRQQDWDSLSTILGEEHLKAAIQQSLGCEPNLFGEAIRTWLEEWHRCTRNQALTRTLQGAVGAQ